MSIQVLPRVEGHAGLPGAFGIAERRGCPSIDLYHLLAYCTVLGLKVGHLIYAAGNEEAVHHVVRRAGVEIICHALDLTQPPTILLTEVSDLARQISLIDWDRPLSERAVLGNQVAPSTWLSTSGT